MMPRTWGLEPVSIRATVEICERCGRLYVRGQDSLTAFCSFCTRTDGQARRVTKPVAPEMFDRLDAARYRPEGTIAQVWDRIHEEAGIGQEVLS